MRSYTNRDGQRTEVSEEHLKTAIKIKKSLQNASPSRKASLSKLVKMMETEGFYDAEVSENYRCLLKSYQKSIGELPEAKKYADMVSDGKLQSIKDLVGEISYEKRENQHYLREINKGKRELIDFAILVEEIKSAIENYDWSFLNFDKIQIRETVNGKIMIACLSDLHIGALVDTDINKFDYSIAILRMRQYMMEIIKEAKDNDISIIHIVNLGDTIEHASMRYSQGYNAEFTFSEQIVKSADLIIKFLVGLAEEGFHISYAGFAGNHDRITDKDKNIDGDHAIKPINAIIKSFIDNSKATNILYHQAQDYGHSLRVNGCDLKFVHGDLDSIKDETLVAKHTSLDNIPYDMVVMGHYHHFREIEVGYDKRIVAFGSLKGADEYSHKLRRLSVASQGIIIVDGDGEIDVKRIKLS